MCVNKSDSMFVPPALIRISSAEAPFVVDSRVQMVNRIAPVLLPSLACSPIDTNEFCRGGAITPTIHATLVFPSKAASQLLR